MHDQTADRVGASMSDLDPNDQIKEAPEFNLPAPARPDDLTIERRPRRTTLSGTLFGACVAMPMGALAGSLCYWIMDYGDYAWDGVLYGSAAGLPTGALIGFIERTVRGDVARADTATYVGGIFGSLLAVLLVIGFSTYGGTFGAMVLAGILCAGPMFGFLIGAVFDRSFESAHQHAWPAAIFFASLGSAACLAPAHLITQYSDPDPRQIERQAMKLILDHWRADPDMRNAKIGKVTLGPPDHRVYVGSFEAHLDRLVFPFDLEVHVRRDEIKASWKPRP